MADGEADAEEVQEIVEAANTAWLRFLQQERPESLGWSESRKAALNYAFVRGFCLGVSYGAEMQQRLYEGEG